MKLQLTIMLLLSFFLSGYCQKDKNVDTTVFVLCPLLREADAPEFIRYTRNSFLMTTGDFFILDENSFQSSIAKDTLNISENNMLLEKTILWKEAIEEYKGLEDIPFVNSFGITNLLMLDISPIIKINKSYFVYNKVRIECRQIKVKSYEYFNDYLFHNIYAYLRLFQILEIKDQYILSKSFRKDKLNDFIFSK